MSGSTDKVPEPLATRMAEALSKHDHAVAGTRVEDALDTATPDALAEAGFIALQRALAQGDDRSAAFDLLAADALITQACVHAASRGLPDALAPERFAALLEDR